MLSITLRLIAFYLRFSRPLVVFAVLTGLLAGLTSVVMVGLISSRVSNPEAAMQDYIWAFAMLAIAQFVLTVITNLLATHLAERTGFDLRLRFCRRILATPLRRLEEAGNHRMLAVLTQDITNIANACLQVPQVCISIAVLVGCMFYLGALSSRMLAVLAVLIVLAVVSIKLLEGRAAVYMRRGREEYDALVKHYTALTDGMKELKLHRRRREGFFQTVLAASAAALRRENTMTGTVYSVVSGWGLVLYFVVVGLLLFVLPDVDKSVGREGLTGYAITVLFMRSYVIAVMVLLPYFGQAAVSLKKLEALGLSLAASADADPDGGDDADDAAPASWERLELKGVTHAYYREKENDNFTLGPVDLALRPGEVVFVVGGNGSGKTTLAKLLTGLYAPESGHIELDGVPVTDETRDAYRQNFSVVFTDFYLFEQLLGLGGENLDEEARAYIDELQLNHKVRVAGGTLSTLELSYGQRKRLALLAALLENRPIYVFDEWEAGQDPAFREVFYRQFVPGLKARGKTVVVISHDDRYYQVADRIVRLEYGKVEYDRRVGEAFAAPGAQLLPAAGD